MMKNNIVLKLTFDDKDNPIVELCNKTPTVRQATSTIQRLIGVTSGSLKAMKDLGIRLQKAEEKLKALGYIDNPYEAAPGVPRKSLEGFLMKVIKFLCRHWYWLVLGGFVAFAVWLVYLVIMVFVIK